MHDTHFTFDRVKFKVAVKERAGEILARRVLSRNAWLLYLKNSPMAVSNNSDKVIYVAPEFRV